MHSHEVILHYGRAIGIWFACACGLLFAAVCCAEVCASEHDVQTQEWGVDSCRAHCICGWSEDFAGHGADVQAYQAGEAHLKSFRKGETKCF